MKTADFIYERPNSLQDALELLADQSVENRIIAGGQSLVPMMNFRLVKPERLIDINNIPSFQNISFEGEIVNIGPLVRYSDLLENSNLCDAIPLFPMVVPFVAHEAIRNRGTIGGSIALADPSAEMPALMLALNAKFELTGPNSSRWVDAIYFFKGMFETDCKSDEILTSIQLPTAKSGDKFGFHELSRRHGDYAIVGSLISVIKNRLPAVAFFGLSERPLRFTELDEILQSHLATGVAFSKERFISILESVVVLNDNHASDSMRRHLAWVVFQRAVRSIG